MQRICEKCGVVIGRPTTKNLFKRKVLFETVTFFRTTSDFSSEEVDLCDKCHDLFTEWLEEKPNSGDACA